MGDTVTRNHPAEIPDRPSDDELEILLDSVKRIADGVEGIRAVFAGPAPEPAPVRDLADVGRATTTLRTLRDYLDNARSSHETIVSVPRGLLRDAVWALEDLGLKR